MGLLDYIGKKKITNLIIDNGQGNDYDINQVGTLQIPDKLTNDNAFILANTVAEIYFPIDFIADRISKLRFFIAKKDGKEIKSTDLLRFINNPNPLFSFGDLVYQAVFSLLADGNIYFYNGVPSGYTTVSPATIDRFDILNPSILSIDEHTNISLLEVKDRNAMIKRIQYNDGKSQNYLSIDKFHVFTYDARLKEQSNILCKSPLFKSYRSINNLLATYSARYNVYVNNGAAGYLAKKQNAAVSDLAAAINNDARTDILKDLNSQNGLTGKRNLWGISGVPIEFVNTLIDIQKLMPFEETLEDSIKIASTYQIPANLVPRKDQSTFDNQADSDKVVWENAIMSVADSICGYFSVGLGIDKLGYYFNADYSNVSALQIGESEHQDVMTKKISNSLSLYEKGIITYNDMLLQIGREPVAEGNKLIFDMTKTPYAVKLGVGGTQALQMVLTDQTMTNEQKLNTLIVVFGLTPEEAKQIISI